MCLRGDSKGSESLKALCGWNKALRVTTVNVAMLDLLGNQLCMGVAQAKATPENTDTAAGKARKVSGVAVTAIKFLLTNTMGT